MSVTWTGVVLALIAAAVVAAERPVIGLVIWLVSRIADGLDGLVAREGRMTTAYGGFMDITLDMAAYSGMVLGFAIAYPEYGLMWTCVLAGYVLAVTTTLALAAAAERLGRTVVVGNRTFQFTRGLAEAGETTVVYVLWTLWPAAIAPVGWAWCGLLLASAIQRSWWARRALRGSPGLDENDL